MTDQPKALRLADFLTDRNRLDLTCDEAAAELRRQHAEIKRLKQAEPVQAEPVSALTRYNEIAADSDTYTGHALERLRIFCSLAMTEEDWLDVEPFFDDAEQELAKLEQAEPVAEPAIAVVTASSDFSATVDWTLNPLPVGTHLYEAPQQAEPVVEPVVSVTWSEVVRQQAAFCDSHCTWLDHASDCPIGNPSF